MDVIHRWPKEGEVNINCNEGNEIEKESVRKEMDNGSKEGIAGGERSQPALGRRRLSLNGI